MLSCTLNHIDLQVPDVQATALFFERYFGFSHRSNRTSPAIAILDNEQGFVLVLQRRKDDRGYPEGFHVGFLVDTEAPVLDFQARARAEGLDVSDVTRNNRGTMVYCRAPGEVLVEVSCRRAERAPT